MQRETKHSFSNLEVCTRLCMSPLKEETKKKNTVKPLPRWVSSILVAVLRAWILNVQLFVVSCDDQSCLSITVISSCSVMWSNHLVVTLKKSLSYILKSQTSELPHRPLETLKYFYIPWWKTERLLNIQSCKMLAWIFCYCLFCFFFVGLKLLFPVCASSAFSMMMSVVLVGGWVTPSDQCLCCVQLSSTVTVVFLKAAGVCPFF